MKRRLAHALVSLTLVVGVSAAAVVTVAHADAPSATVAASQTAAPPDDTLPPALATQTIPGERSAVPTADEWKGAVLVEPTRRSPRASLCRVYLVREYVKVHCPYILAGIRQHTGGSKDVQLWVTPKKIDPDGINDLSAAPNGGQVIFPLARGEARMFQFFELSFEGYGGASPASSVVVDSYWASGRPAPNLILR